jgi:hypothetical protein
MTAKKKETPFTKEGQGWQLVDSAVDDLVREIESWVGMDTKYADPDAGEQEIQFKDAIDKLKGQISDALFKIRAEFLPEYDAYVKSRSI